MSSVWWRTSGGLNQAGNVAKALAALLAPGAIASLAGAGAVAIVLLAIGALAALAAVVLTFAEGQVKAREHAQALADEARARLRLLATTRPGRERVPRVAEVSAYDLGADREAITPSTRGDVDPSGYVERDRDLDLEQALRAARTSDAASLVVIRGPSKAGKSRTLFEAVYRDPQLRDAWVLAPRDGDALTDLLALERLPETSDGRLVLLWLDDLERFVRAGRGGMDGAALDALADWRCGVIAVATAGGKGADACAPQSALSMPIQSL